MVKVLVVDDREGWREQSSDILAEFGHDVITASDIGEGEAKVKEAMDSNVPFDVIITDRRMGGDPDAGINIARHLREKGINTPVIMMSSSELSSVESMSLKGIINAFCSKEQFRALMPAKISDLTRVQPTTSFTQGQK